MTTHTRTHTHTHTRIDTHTHTHTHTEGICIPLALLALPLSLSLSFPPGGIPSVASQMLTNQGQQTGRGFGCSRDSALKNNLNFARLTIKQSILAF